LLKISHFGCLQRPTGGSIGSVHFRLENGQQQGAERQSGQQPPARQSAADRTGNDSTAAEREREA